MQIAELETTRTRLKHAQLQIKQLTNKCAISQDEAANVQQLRHRESKEAQILVTKQQVLCLTSRYICTCMECRSEVLMFGN